ncbi:transposase [Ruminococcus flavefaciens]|uniref:transposase n=1 Tax=Ruminococcus flavefaciens TaxID=1265 RepID=UPI000941F502
MRLRKIWCEGNFSHQKECHNLRRTRKRGIERVTEQCLLSACALNLKRLVEILFLLQYSAIISVRKLFGLFFIVKTWVCQQHQNGHPFTDINSLIFYL